MIFCFFCVSMREKECVCEIGEILVWVWWDWWEYDDGLVAAVTQKNAGSVTVSSSPTLAQDGPADPWPLRTHNITESVLQSFRDTQDRDCELLNILMQEESRDPWPSWTEKEQVIEKRFCSPATQKMSSKFLFGHHRKKHWNKSHYILQLQTPAQFFLQKTDNFAARGKYK